MKIIFLIHTPRSGAGFIRALLTHAPGVIMTPEAGNILQKLKKNDTDPVASLEKWIGEATVAVVPSSEFGAWAVAGQHWNDTVDSLSWLIKTWPDASLAVLTRDPKDCAKSMERTWPLWTGKHGGGLKARVRQMEMQHEYISDFAEMNRQIVKSWTFYDLFKPDAMKPALVDLGVKIEEEAWEIVARSGKPIEDFPPPALTMRQEWQEEMVDRGMRHMRAYLSKQQNIPPDQVILHRPSLLWPEKVLKQTLVEKHEPKKPRRFTEFFSKKELKLPTMSISIMAHPSRRDLVKKLVENLGDDVPISWDNGIGLIRNCEETWKLHDPSADYHLVIQDDTILCDNFVQEARIILESLPEPTVVSFFHSSQKPYVNKALEASSVGLDFSESHEVPGPAICLPTSWISDMLAFYNAHNDRKDDRRISGWLKKNNRLAFFPLPSLVDHLDGQSLAGNRGGHRPSAFFVKNRGQPPAGLKDSPRAVFYQWLSTASNWDELKFSLRALLCHFKDKTCPIYVVSDREPEWYLPGDRLKVITVEAYNKSAAEGLWEARTIGLQCAERILQLDDDIYMLHDMGWEDFEIIFSDGALSGREAALIATGRGWYMSMAEASLDMQKHGVELPYLRFSTHTPFLWERSKMVEILRRYYINHRGSLENLYYNVFKPPTRSKSPWVVKSLPANDDARLLNHAGGGPDFATKEELRNRFPTMAPWEARVPRIIHQTWRDSNIPRDVYPERWTKSWKLHHPDWEYLFWTDEDLNKFTADNYPEFNFLIREARGVIKADVGRLLILYHFGGIYADMDYLCLKPMDTLITGNSAFVSTLGRNYTHNALMACSPRYPMMMDAAKEALKRWNRARDATPEFISGPDLITSMVKKYRPTHWDPELVCPIDWRTSPSTGHGDVDLDFPDAHAVTFWRHNW